MSLRRRPPGGAQSITTKLSLKTGALSCLTSQEKIERTSGGTLGKSAGKTSRTERLPWETAGGPEVGQDIPITGEPRAELAPGVPAPPPEEPDSHENRELEEREVVAEDPELSPEINQQLTEELREVVGSDRVKVPADRPRPSRGEERPRQSGGAYLSMHRMQLIRITVIVLTLAAIISLATGYWWLLGVAAGVHALGTMTVTMFVVRLTTITERPSPTLAAAMTEEGVASPEERFSEMVEEFREQPDHGASEVLSPGFNERTASASENPAQATAEQSSAMTPTAEPSQPVGEGRGLPRLSPRSLVAIVIGVAFTVAVVCTVLALALRH